MLFERFTGIGNNLIPFVRVFEQSSDDVSYRFAVVQLNDAVLFAEFVHQKLKVLHMGTCYYRFVRENRFNRILAAYATKTLSDDNNRSHRIPVAKFAGRIDYQNGSAGFEVRLRPKGV